MATPPSRAGIVNPWQKSAASRRGVVNPWDRPASPGARFRDPSVPAMTNTGEAILPAPPRQSTLGENLAGAAETFLQGVNPGQDEMMGLLGPNDFTKDQQAAQARLRTFAQENPTISSLLKITGAVAPALATAGGSLVPQAAGRMAARPAVGELMKIGAKTGAKWAAPYSFLAAEGDVVDRLPETAIGTVAGAAIGGAVPAVLRGGSNAWDFARNAFGQKSAPSTLRSVAEGLEQEVSGTGQTWDDVVGRAKALEAAGTTPTVAEALGPAGPRAVGRMRYGLSADRGANGTSPAGRASAWADDLDKAREGAKQAGAPRTGPVAQALYKQAGAVGEVPFVRATPGTPPTDAQLALKQLDELFPDVHGDVMARLARRVQRKELGAEHIANMSPDGPHTLPYWDAYKKAMDGVLRKHKVDPQSTVARETLSEARTLLATVLGGVDEAVTQKAGAPIYAQARAAAQADITTRRAAEPAQKKLASGLRWASNTQGAAPNPETAIAQMHRPKIAAADVGLDILKSGARKSHQRDAAQMLEWLQRTDVDQFVQDILAQELAARQAGLGVAGRVGRASGTLAPLFSRAGER